jgi:diadenosine tetraphosphate (Ap4A) HIT family hydrolase
VLVLKRHATELFELSREERSELIEEVSAVARCLAAVFAAVKVNYELLGNQVPHIHWHILPRVAGDPALGRPAWTVEHERQPLSPEELRARIALIQSRLER